MNIKDFFGKAKEICKNNLGCCSECPLCDYCCDGIFARDESEIDELTQIVNKVRTYTKADNGKLSRVAEFPSGEKVELPINKDGSVKWFDDNRLLKKGKQDEQA